MTTTGWTSQRFEIDAVPLPAALDALARPSQATGELLRAVNETDGAAAHAGHTPGALTAGSYRDGYRLGFGGRSAS